jgi:hypothetical protein
MRRSVAAVGGAIRLSTVTGLAGKKTPPDNGLRLTASSSLSHPVQRTMDSCVHGVAIAPH